MLASPRFTVLSRTASFHHFNAYSIGVSDHALLRLEHQPQHAGMIHQRGLMVTLTTLRTSGPLQRRSPTPLPIIEPARPATGGTIA